MNTYFQEKSTGTLCNKFVREKENNASESNANEDKQSHKTHMQFEGILVLHFGFVEGPVMFGIVPIRITHCVSSVADIISL